MVLLQKTKIYCFPTKDLTEELNMTCLYNRNE